ncbi:MAG: hypothetical protein BIFFINMI_00642 [Phycisphaerae bacterium]|nr:hypothetical protein [Phycisphaerae bacterium]
MRKQLTVLAGILFITAAVSGCAEVAIQGGRFAGPEVDLPDSDLNLQRLINEAKDGGVVEVPLGCYVLTKPLTIARRNDLHIAFAPGTQVRVANTDLHVIEMTDCQKVRISGVRARHVTPLAEYNCHGSVVLVRDSKDVMIFNCELNGCGAIGVNARNVQKLQVINCHIHHNTFNGLYLDTCDNVELIGNIIEDNANSLTTYKCGEVILSDNLVHRNGGYWHEALRPGLTPATQPDLRDK